jgi:disulfide bond formation protein DsbB
MPRLYLLAATVNAWVLILVLALAFVVQFASGELPCPLCVMQRIGLMLCALAPLYVLISQRDGEVTVRDVAVAGGIGVVAGLVGAAASARQVMLHILPNDPGFGHPVFGLVAANIVSVVAEAGFNWLLPENPIHYLLFK